METGIDLNFKVLQVEHESINCPNCGACIDYGQCVINAKSLYCVRCKCSFSYMDGYIEKVLKEIESGIKNFLVLPVCLGVIEHGTEKIKIGQVKKIPFVGKYNKIYGIDLLFEDTTKRTPNSFTITKTCLNKNRKYGIVDITNESFTIISSSTDPNDLNQEEKTYYQVSARDASVNIKIPIWHIFLQSTLDLYGRNDFGPCIVTAMSTFDAYLDDILTNEFNNRNLKIDTIDEILRKFRRSEKLYSLLFEFFNKSFKECQYNKELGEIAKLRNKIVHPKEYNFDEKTLTPPITESAIITIARSIKWINNLKNTK